MSDKLTEKQIAEALEVVLTKQPEESTCLDLWLLRQTNVARCEEVFHSLARWSVNDWAVAAGGELGEAQNVAKKLRRLDDADAKEDTQARRDYLRMRLALELADALIYMDLLAARAGIDLAAATAFKFNVISDERGSSWRLPKADGRMRALALQAPNWLDGQEEGRDTAPLESPTMVKEFPSGPVENSYEPRHGKEFPVVQVERRFEDVRGLRLETKQPAEGYGAAEYVKLMPEFGNYFAEPVEARPEEDGRKARQIPATQAPDVWTAGIDEAKAGTDQTAQETIDAAALQDFYDKRGAKDREE